MLSCVVYGRAQEYDLSAAFPSASAYTPFSLGLAFLLVLSRPRNKQLAQLCSVTLLIRVEQVFRSSQAYSRYYEANSHCFQMRSQLSNACMLVCVCCARCNLECQHFRYPKPSNAMHESLVLWLHRAAGWCLVLRSTGGCSVVFFHET